MSQPQVQDRDRGCQDTTYGSAPRQSSTPHNNTTKPVSPLAKLISTQWQGSQRHASSAYPSSKEGKGRPQKTSWSTSLHQSILRAATNSLSCTLLENEMLS